VKFKLLVNFLYWTVNSKNCRGGGLPLPLPVIYFNCYLFTLEFVLAKFSENILNFRRQRAPCGVLRYGFIFLWITILTVELKRSIRGKIQELASVFILVLLKIRTAQLFSLELLLVFFLFFFLFPFNFNSFYLI